MTDPEPKKNLALKLALLHTGSKQEYIAKVAQISANRLSKIVGGHVKATRAERLKISNALAIPESQLFDTPSYQSGLWGSTATMLCPPDCPFAKPVDGGGRFCPYYTTARNKRLSPKGPCYFYREWRRVNETKSHVVVVEGSGVSSGLFPGRCSDQPQAAEEESGEIIPIPPGLNPQATEGEEP